jgi:hypothetical protein
MPAAFQNPKTPSVRFRALVEEGAGAERLEFVGY